MNTHNIKLPPLPESRIVSYQIDSTMRRMELRTYSDEDMRDYARAAIEAGRQTRSEPVGYIAAGLLSLYLEKCREHGVDLHIENLPVASRPPNGCATGAVPIFLSPQPPQIPSGWQLVPKEPTSEMKTAAIGVEVYQESPPELDALTWEEVGAIYQAMLAAAPKPEDTQ